MTPIAVHVVRRMSVGLLALLTFAATPAGGQAPAAGGKDESLSAVLPYVGEGTFVVGRLDVDRVDQEAFGDYMERSTERMLKVLPIPPNQLEAVKKNATDSVNTSKQWLTDLSKAGGRHVYMLFDMEDVTPIPSPIVLVPFGAAEDGEKIAAHLTQTQGPGQQQQVAQLGRVVAWTMPTQIERLKKQAEGGAKPVERPDLASALAAGGAAPLRFAVVPGEPARKWVEERLPALPAALGGGDTKTLSRGVRYATLALVQKPDTVGKVSVRCTDAAQAKALLDVLTKGLATAKEMMGANAPQGAELTKSLENVKPKAEGDTITFDVDPLALQMGTMGMRVRHEAEVVPAPGKPPAKADDGGL